MKKPWDTFEKNYVAVETTVDDQSKKSKIRYEYCGPWFVLKSGASVFKKAKWKIGIALVINTAAVLWAGTQTAIVNVHPATCVPYGLALAALVFTIFGSVLLLLSGAQLTRPYYDRMNRILRFAPPIQACLLFAAFAAGLVLTLAENGLSMELLPIAGYLLSGCSAAVTFFVYRSLCFKQEKNTNFEFAPSDPFNR